MAIFDVHTGRPSWHQARAGHLSSGCMRFSTRQDADRYAAAYRRNHPGEPVFVVELK